MKNTTTSKTNEQPDIHIHIWEKVGKFFKGVIGGNSIKIPESEIEKRTKTIGGVHLFPDSRNEPLRSPEELQEIEKKRQIAIAANNAARATGKGSKRKDKKKVDTICAPEDDRKAGLKIDPRFINEVETFTVSAYPTTKREDLPHGQQKKNLYFNTRFTRPPRDSHEQLKNILTKEIQKRF